MPLTADQVTGMVEFKVYSTSDPSCFALFIANIQQSQHVNISVQLADLFVSSFAEVWTPAYQIVYGKLEAYTKQTTLRKGTYISTLMRTYGASKDDVVLFDMKLKDVLTRHMADPKQPASMERRPHLDVASETALILPTIPQTFHDDFQAILRMLKYSAIPWYLYAFTSSTPHPRQVQALVLEIHTALAYSRIIAEVCRKLPLFDKWRQSLLGLCESYSPVHPPPARWLHQWDNIGNAGLDPFTDESDKEDIEKKFAADTFMDRYKTFEKRMGAIFNSDAVFGFEREDGEGKYYEEGVVTAWKELRKVRRPSSPRFLSLTITHLERLSLSRQEGGDSTESEGLSYRP